LTRESMKDEIIVEINELAGEKLSSQTEWALRKLTLLDLYRMRSELREGTNGDSSAESVANNNEQ
jgi:hypothetical protein